MHVDEVIFVAVTDGRCTLLQFAVPGETASGLALCGRSADRPGLPGSGKPCALPGSHEWLDLVVVQAAMVQMPVHMLVEQVE